MPYDGQGVFTRVHNWEEDAANDISILASRHDAEDDNFANGFNEVLCRDGRAAMTGNLKMGANKITGLANGTTDNDAVNLSQLNSTSSTLSTAINTAISNAFSSIYPVGSMYIGKTSTCPIAALIPSSTWTVVASNVVIGVNSTVEVKGNSKALGLRSGSKTFSMVTDSNDAILSTSLHTPSGANVGSVPGGTSSSGYTRYEALGVDTNASNSGLTGTASVSNLTATIWERTA